MSDSENAVHGSGQKALKSKGIDATEPAATRVYFHPDSETLLFVEGEALERESNQLNVLLAQQVDSQMRLEDLTQQCTALSWEQKTQRSSLQIQIEQEAKLLDKFNNELKVELTQLSAVEELPEVSLLDEGSKSAVGMMELIEMRGGAKGVKYTYVRSNKIRSHWKRYSLNEKEKKGGEKSFVTQKTFTDSNGQTRTRQAIDYKKIKEQFSKIKPKMQGKEWDLIEPHTEILGEWAEKMNESLKSSPYQGERFGFDSQSQLMRWSYGAGFSEEFSPFEMDLRKKGAKRIKKEAELGGKLSGYANLALAESKSKLSLCLPDIRGMTICYPRKPEMGGGMAELGALRFDAEIVLAGSVGVSLGVELGVTVTSNWAKGVPGRVDSTETPGLRKLDVTKIVEDSETKAELAAFAGARASVNISGAIMWYNPEKVPDKEKQEELDKLAAKNKNLAEKEKFTQLAKVSAGVEAQMGVGWNGTLQFMYDRGKVRILASGGLCWGGGAKGTVAFDVDTIAIMTDFMPCLTYMLRNADYIRLSESVIRGGDFYAFCALPLLISMHGANYIANITFSLTEELIESLMQSWTAKELRVALMENILNSEGECLKYSPPESKGAAIDCLINNSFWDEVASPASHERTTCEVGGRYNSRKRAVLLALRWVQSRRDYENVMQHMSLKFHVSGTWQENEARVVAFLADGENTPIDHSKLYPAAPSIKIYPSHYAENLHNIYRSLPQTVEVTGDEKTPLKPVSEALMYSCSRFIL